MSYRLQVLCQLLDLASSLFVQVVFRFLKNFLDRGDNLWNQLSNAFVAIFTYGQLALILKV
jgi:hypothetical protein